MSNKKTRTEYTPSEEVSFSSAFSAWIENRKRSVKQVTVDRYEYLINRYVIHALGDMQVGSITTSVVNQMLKGLADSGDDSISLRTMETLLMLTNSILTFAREGSDAKDELFKDVKIEKNPYKSLEPDEIRRLIRCAKMNHCPEMLGVLFALYTGIGTGELSALVWDDVDRDRREIHIHSTLYRVRDKDSDDKRTRLEIVDVRKSAVRTAIYPEELRDYVDEFYRKGTFFLTGEKRFMEQRTLSNRLEKIFEMYNLSGLTLQRVNKTFKEGLADERFLTDPYYLPDKYSEISSGSGVSGEDACDGYDDVNRSWLIQEMKNDLKPLRELIGLSAANMGQVIGLSEDDYLALEAGEKDMDWSGFLSLLFFFKYNAKTDAVVDALGLYPRGLRSFMAIEVDKA